MCRFFLCFEENRVDAQNVMKFDALTAARFRHFNQLYLRTREVPGDIVECGVCQGRSVAMLLLAMKLEGEQVKRLWAFDSFEGFPDPTPEDTSDRQPAAGQLAVTLEQARRFIDEIVMDPQFVASRAQFVKGFFEDTLALMQDRRIALLHLDVDLYSSYKTCLESLWDRVSPGGIVTFDEFVRGQVKFPGGVKAITEFFDGKGLTFERDHYASNYFVEKPRASHVTAVRARAAEVVHDGVSAREAETLR